MAKKYKYAPINVILKQNLPAAFSEFTRSSFLFRLFLWNFPCKKNCMRLRKVSKHLLKFLFYASFSILLKKSNFRQPLKVL